MNYLSSCNTNFDEMSFDTTRYAHRTVEARRYSAERNLNELTKLINRLFELHSRLLVVRVDLSYKKEVSQYVGLEVLQRHREQLLGDRRRHGEVFKGLVGYAWCLEYGEREGGYHYHVLALYDGAQRRDDIGLGRSMGALWERITEGGGRCYISNFDKEKLDRQGHLGIGMIHRNQEPLRINLVERVAAYLTKKCTVFDMTSARTVSGEFRTFGKSNMPAPLDPNLPRRGRPPVASTGMDWKLS